MHRVKIKTRTFRHVLHITIWRRNRDLNPGTELPVYELSKPAPSASWVFLQNCLSVRHIGNVRMILYKKALFIKREKC